MEKIIYLIPLVLFAGAAVAGPTGILHSAAKPSNGGVLVKDFGGVRHASSLYSYVSIVRNERGENLLKLKHSNGIHGDQTISFAVRCNPTGKIGVDHQYLGFSYHGSVEREQYYKVDCPSNDLGLRFSAKEVWNPIDIAAKAATLIWGQYVW